MPSFSVLRSVILVPFAVFSVVHSRVERGRLAYVSRQQCQNSGQRRTDLFPVEHCMGICIVGATARDGLDRRHRTRV